MFLHIFSATVVNRAERKLAKRTFVHSSSRYEKRCRMLQRHFWLFQCSKNQLCYEILARLICRDVIWFFFLIYKYDTQLFSGCSPEKNLSRFYRVSFKSILRIQIKRANVSYNIISFYLVFNAIHIFNLCFACDHASPSAINWRF